MEVSVQELALTLQVFEQLEEEAGLVEQVKAPGANKYLAVLGLSGSFSNFSDDEPLIESGCSNQANPVP